MRVLVAGSSGFLGTHLREELERRGHEVVRLVRRPASGPLESEWDPYSGRLDRAEVERADVVVNLAGTPTVGNPHSRTWAENLRRSRVTTTRLLAEAVAASERRPAYLAQNAVGWYGDHGTEPVTEQADSRGETLMTGVCRDWQAAADPAVEVGARVCILRTAPVIDRRSAPLKQLRVLFRLGLGARLGSGAQFMPIISLRDWVGGVTHLVEHPTVSGPVNLCSARTPTNREFTKALADAVHRPALAVAPAAVLRLAAGPLAPEVLSSVDTVPAALLSADYHFRDPDASAVVRAGLG